MIHNAPFLQPIQKLHYLRSSLKGGAAKTLTNLCNSSDNYTIAWNKLISRFDKPDIITESLIEKFTKLPQVNRDGSGISALVDDVEVILGALDKVAVMGSNRDPWLIYLIKEKCDPDTRQRWNDQIASNPNRSWADFIKFLEKRGVAKDAYGSRASLQARKTDRDNPKKNTSAFSSTSSSGCGVCLKNHMVYQCPEFAAFDPGKLQNTTHYFIPPMSPQVSKKTEGPVPPKQVAFRLRQMSVWGSRLQREYWQRRLSMLQTLWGSQFHAGFYLTQALSPPL
ncbi:uncharacterized protein LOC122520378 [Polistes fuscatus]|uniref:uncharacterized protein LOC122520378 n=1 Tax=Polistes fuscatus TaxID=30207 RepID=UPI001CA86FF0|nr:uncharacterized protein LOC122520378 [Polistes fuscatus]